MGNLIGLPLEILDPSWHDIENLVTMDLSNADPSDAQNLLVSWANRGLHPMTMVGGAMNVSAEVADNIVVHLRQAFMRVIVNQGPLSMAERHILTNTLAYCSNLRALGLANVGLEDANLQVMTAACQQILHLDLSGNIALSDVAVQDLATSLHQLRTISLVGCSNVGNAGAQSLVNEYNGNLTSVYTQNTLITAVGAAALRDVGVENVWFQSIVDNNTANVPVATTVLRPRPRVGFFRLANIIESCPNLLLVDLRGVWGMAAMTAPAKTRLRQVCVAHPHQFTVLVNQSQVQLAEAFLPTGWPRVTEEPRYNVANEQI